MSSGMAGEVFPRRQRVLIACAGFITGAPVGFNARAALQCIGYTAVGFLLELQVLGHQSKVTGD